MLLKAVGADTDKFCTSDILSHIIFFFAVCTIILEQMTIQLSC